MRPTAAEPAPRDTRILTLVVASALFMESLVSTVIATSLAPMAADLGVDPLQLKLAFTAYYVALAIFIPASSWCADRYGARTVFTASIALFSLASVGCALAGDEHSLVAGRFCQGAAGAMMLPVGRLILLRLIPKREMLSAMAWLSIPTLFAPIIGPPVGGWITTTWHWRGIFWLNVPVGVAGLAAALWLIPNVKAEVLPRLDARGLLLSGGGLALGIFGLTLVGSRGQSGAGLALALGMTAAGAALLAAYVRHARRTDEPALDLRLLAIPAFRIPLLSGLVFRLAVGALPFLLPLMLQLGFGLSALQSGLLTFASAVGAVAMKPVAGPILRRWGFRRVLRVNAVVAAVLMAATGLIGAGTPAAVTIGLLLVGGFFRSLQFTSLNTLSYADIQPAMMSRATAFVAVAQQLALAAGVALAALLLDLLRSAQGRQQLVGDDFRVALALVGLLALASLPPLRRLAPDAGAEVSGHRLPDVGDEPGRSG